jgi:hypothetical protein
MMTYRARMIGGALDIAARVGGGTVLTCRLPAEMNLETPGTEPGEAPQNGNVPASGASASGATASGATASGASSEQQPHVA